MSDEVMAITDKTQKDWMIEPGDFEIQIGASSSDIKLRDLITAE
ncbi:MAG: hypothetical protein ACYSO1_00945 [Planctomycetota bacterium]